MPHFYILNESTDMSAAGDVTLFNSIEGLIGSVEAIDVQNGEYSCFMSDGRKVSLTVEGDYSPIQSTTENLPSHQKEVESILRTYLRWLIRNGKIKTDVAEIDRADLTKLTELVPSFLIR
jgi:hypothetical protein